MPLLTPHISNSSTAGAPPVQQCSALNPYAVLREVVMKQASLTGEDIECGRGQPLQQEGLALTFGKHLAVVVVRCILSTPCQLLLASAGEPAQQTSLALCFYVLNRCLPLWLLLWWRW